MWFTCEESTLIPPQTTFREQEMHIKSCNVSIFKSTYFHNPLNVLCICVWKQLGKNNCTSGKCFFFLQCRRHRHHFQHYLHQSEIWKKDLNLFLNIMASTKVIYNITVVQYFTLSKLKKIVLTLSCALVWSVIPGIRKAHCTTSQVTALI